MTRYTLENYQSDRALQEELKGYAYSKKPEEREQRDAYWDSYYRADAFLTGGQAAKEIQNGDILSDRRLPWSGNHLDHNLAIFAGELIANGVRRVLLDTNQGTAFGKQIAGFSKAGWLITGTEEQEVDHFGETKTQTFLVLRYAERHTELR